MINKGDCDQILVSVTVLITFYKDYNYGADADGNRGVEETFIEGWEIGNLTDSESGEDVTHLFEKHPEVIEFIEKEICNGC